MARRSSWREVEADLFAATQQLQRSLGYFAPYVNQTWGKPQGTATTPGYPDVMLYCAGWCVPVELKRRRKGRLSDDQKDFITLAGLQGVPVLVVTSIEQWMRLVCYCKQHPNGGTDGATRGAWAALTRACAAADG